MNFQRILLLLVVLLAAGLAGAFYMNWKTLGQLRTVKAFVEGSVFADAVAACEKAQSTTPFKWTGGKRSSLTGRPAALYRAGGAAELVPPMMRSRFEV